jgi:DHA1 family tetracycline resistance protein-like MFS transporter
VARRNRSATTADHGRPPRPKPPQGFWVIWSTVAVDQIVFSMVLPVLPFLARKYDASPFQITALVASYALAQFVLSPFLGGLSDRVGRKPVLVVALFGSALGSLVVGLAGALPLLFLGRVIDGASGTALVSAQTAITDMVPPKDRARYLGLMGSAFAVGFIIGPALSGIASLADPKLPFFIAAGLALVNALAAIVRLPETHPPGTRAEETTTSGRGFRSVLRGARDVTPAAWFYIGAFAACLFAFSAVEGGTFTLLTADRFNFSSSDVAWVFVMVGVILALVQVLLVGPANERFGIRGTAVLAMVLNVVGFVLTAASQNVAMLLAGSAFNATGQGLLRPTSTAAISNAVPPQSRGAAIGVLSSAQGAMRISGPLAAGALFQSVGDYAPFVLGAGISTVTAVVTAGPGARFDDDVTQHEFAGPPPSDRAS